MRNKQAAGFGVRRQDAALSSFKAVPWRRTPRRFAHQNRNAGVSPAPGAPPAQWGLTKIAVNPTGCGYAGNSRPVSYGIIGQSSRGLRAIVVVFLESLTKAGRCNKGMRLSSPNGAGAFRVTTRSQRF